MTITKFVEIYKTYHPEEIEEETPEFLSFQQNIIKCGDPFKSKNNKGKSIVGRICSPDHTISTVFIFKEQIDKYEYYL